MPAYSGKAQPFLDSIANGFFTSREVRNWLTEGLPVEEEYRDAEPLIDEQRSVRWASKPTKQPFWANYWCGRDSKCTCRIEGSKGLESDAIFFLRNQTGRRLAIHVEFKHPNEKFSYGQPEAYPLRAECFARTFDQRKTLNPHEDWATLVFCGDESMGDEKLRNFQRVIFHSEAALRLYDWPKI